MSKELELGQMIFGNPAGGFGTDEYTDALVKYLLSEIGRIYWNKNQDEWDYHDDPGLKGVEFRPYYWGDDNKEAEKPNLKFSHSPQEIRRYKHPGRGQSSSLKMDEKQWREWFEGALKVIRENEDEDD